MKYSKLIIAFVVITSIIFFLLAASKAPTKPKETTSSSQQTQDIYNQVVTIGNKKIWAEIADTNETRQRGLSGRKNMPEDAGMLFVFEEADYYSFWMPYTYFPLDFVWIKGDNIVDLTENVPNHPGTDTDGLPRYTSSQPADKILELNAGQVKSLGIKIGDRIISR